jgi:5'-nucleotidase
MILKLLLLMGGRKTIVLIDLDATVAHFDKAVELEFKTVGWKFTKNRPNWEFEEDENKKMHIVISQKGFYENLEIIDGAVLAITEMIQAGLEVFFCSSPIKKYEHCVVEKYKWVEKHFGLDMAERIILTKDKTIVFGDYLIDDKPHIIGANIKPSWTHIVYNQSYNSNTSATLRMHHWREWRDLIKISCNKD